MGTGWDTADDDLEKLLEFDDLDTLYSLDAGKEILVANLLPAPTATTTTTSEGKFETELVSKGIPKAVSPCNSPKELQAPDDDEVLHLDISSGKAGRTDVSSPSRKRGRELNKEGNCDHLRSSQSDAMNHNFVGEPILSKQRFGRDVSDAIQHSVEENEEQVERLLSGMAREKRVPGEATRVCLGNSQEPSGGASDRLCQDPSAASERLSSDPMQVDEITQLRTVCNQGGLPVDGIRMEGHNITPTTEIFPPPTVLGYRIPGPAGALQSCVSKNGQKTTQGLRYSEKFSGSGRPCGRTSVAAEGLDFRDGPWLAAMEFLNDGHSEFGNDLSRTTIITIKSTRRHIPLVVALINTVTPNGFGDMSVTLKDPTGTVNGSIHRKVLTELEDGHQIVPGAVLVLRKVAVFSPTPRKHYLNITVNNVDRIFGKDVIARRAGGKAAGDSVRNGNFSTSDRHHSISQAALNGISRIQTADKEVYKSASIAPNFGKLPERRVAELQRMPGNNDNVQAVCPTPKSLCKKVRNSLSLPTIPEDNLRRSSEAKDGRLSTNSDLKNMSSEAETNAWQEAMAKAAGWDLSEDIELLLADDFPFTQ